jgi:hypothetical protein
MDRHTAKFAWLRRHPPALNSSRRDQVRADLSAFSGVETIHDPHLEPA